MRMIVGTVGLCLIGFAAGMYFASLRTGACIAIAIFGVGLTVDAMRK